MELGDGTAFIKDFSSSPYFQIGVWLYFRLNLSFLFCSKERLLSGSSNNRLLCNMGEPEAEYDSKAGVESGLTNPTGLPGRAEQIQWQPQPL